MRKLIKTTAIFCLLLLFYSAAFGGGWQKYLPNYGISSFYAMNTHPSTYLPTKDGGVLLYGAFEPSNFNSSNNLTAHYLIKFDKSGNLLWKKGLNKPRIENDTAIIDYYDPQPLIESVCEISNNRFVIFHNGPRYQLKDGGSTIIDQTKRRYITIIDNYGNKISSKIGDDDTIQTTDICATHLNYDTYEKKYVLLSLTPDYISGVSTSKLFLNKRIFDTLFNLINKERYYIGTFSSDPQNTLDIQDSLIIIRSFLGHGYPLNYIAVFNFNGQLKWERSLQPELSSFNNQIADSLSNAPATITGCSTIYQFNGISTQNSNILDDYILDKQGNIHTFGTNNFETNNNNCGAKVFDVLTHIVINKNGVLVKKLTHLFNFYSANADSLSFAGKLLIIPMNDSILNLLTFNSSTYIYLNRYKSITYNINTNQIISLIEKVSMGELSNLYFDKYNNYVRLHKLKSPYDNSYFYGFTNWAIDFTTYSALIKFDSLGNINSHAIQGNVFADQNGNCIKNGTDKNLPQITVKAARDINNTAYTSSDNNGNYVIGVSDSGLYTVTAQPNINYPLFAQGNCAVQTSYAYLDSFTIDTINLNLKPTILCPNMYVDISTPILRRCFSNIYTVNYKNNGTVASANTYIDVALDRFLTVNSASIAYTNLGNNVLRFNLGNVDYLSSGRFTIDVTVRCDSTIVGQTHCVEAHIYPDTVCAVASYTGPVISTTAICKHDSVEFKIRNSGGNMSQRKRYIVIEDNLNRLNGTFQLNTGQQQLVTIAADTGRTYGIIAEQDALFPSQLGDAYASAFIEGCNPVSGTFTTGIITQYPEFDGEPYRSVDCQQNRGSFDPNDKTGYPIGVSAQHYIEKNTAIDFKINFQNTGNDTAFKVVIVDTISKYLDINTIEPGASSHRYTFMRTDSNTIKFIFDNIKLVDSNKNEKLSHGFVKFRIQQKANNPNGTKIYNTAEIYFDYNAPIFTNKTMHTIGDVYVRIISKVINPTYAKADIKIYPNPFRDKTTIELQNMELQQTSLILIDITGKEILQQSSDNNQYEINGSDLAKGFYLFRIKNDTTEIATGKIIVQ